MNLNILRPIPVENKAKTFELNNVDFKVVGLTLQNSLLTSLVYDNLWITSTDSILSFDNFTLKDIKILNGDLLKIFNCKFDFEQFYIQKCLFGGK